VSVPIRPLLFVLLAGTALLALLAPPSEPVDPGLPPQQAEQRANVFTASTQERAAVDLALDGRSVVVWDSRRQEAGGYGVFARWFDAAGRPASHELRVNRTVAGMQSHPAVAVDADGAAWFAWQSFGQDGDAGAVVARRFAADGAPGPEIAVNRRREGHQGEVALAALPEGGVLAAWTSAEAQAGGAPHTRVLARRLDGDGPEFELEAGAQRSLPALAARPGGAAAAWARVEAGRSGVALQLLDAAGRPDGPELRTGASAEAVEPSLAADAAGRLFLAWMEPAGEGYAVHLQRFDAAGAPLGAAERVAATEEGWLAGVAVTAAPDGRHLVAWNREGADGSDVVAARFDAAGRLLGEERLTAATAGDQRLTLATGARRLAWDGARLALAWNGDAGLGDASGAHLSLRHAGAAAPAAELGAPQAAPAAADEDLLAIPPIWNPDWKPQGFLRSARAAGGDFGFEAVPGTGWTPPDPEMAVGPDRIVVMTNGRIACFDRSGSQQWFDEIENSFGFWGGLGANNFVFDPEVTWDPHAGRFLAMACERANNGHSYFLLAVSKDGSPDDAGDWWKYRLDVTSQAGGDIDSPNLAVGTDTILLSADFFSPVDKYLVYLIDKASVLGGGSPVTTHELIQGGGQQSFGAPVVHDATGTLFLVQSTEFGTNTEVILHAITNPFTAYSRVTQRLGVTPYTYPAQPPQKGSSSRPYLFEPRFWSTTQRNGSIWAVHHVNNGRARVRWYEFALNGWPGGGTPAVRQEGELDLGSGISTFFPSIHVDAASNVALTFARSAANEYISIGRALRAAGDPLGTLRPAQVVQVSQNAHTSGRWGDYSGTQADVTNPGEFWGHHEFTNGSTSSWRTWVAQYLLRPAAYELEVPPLTAGASATLTVRGATPGQRSYLAYSRTGTALYEVPQLGTTLSLDAPVLLATLQPNANGDAQLTRNVPPALAGTTLWLQAAEHGRTTNWVQATVQ
jgi:hypothetical protein